MNIEKWDHRFLALASYIAQQWGKDRSTKVGCILANEHKDILSFGYNGFPRGVNDDVEERHQRPDKYMWTEHAERNAIYNAARRGTITDGCTAYVPWFPCCDCCRALIQAGIKTLVAYAPDLTDTKWGVDFNISLTLLEEAGIVVRTYNEEPIRSGI